MITTAAHKVHMLLNQFFFTRLTLPHLGSQCLEGKVKETLRLYRQRNIKGTGMAARAVEVRGPHADGS